MSNRFDEKFRHLHQVPMEYPASIALSTLIHLVLLFAVNHLTDWPDPSSIQFNRWNFEVTFREWQAPRTKAALPPASSNVLATSPSQTPDVISSSPMERASAASEAGASRAEENSRQGDLMPDGADFLAETSPLNPALANEARSPETASANLKLVPRQMAVSSPQRETILKKVKKIVAKLPALMAADTSFAMEKDGQHFQFTVSHFPASSATGFDELGVTVFTVEGDDTLSTRLRMRRLGFSQFAQFVDYWDPHVALHADELDGRFHSNSALVISRTHDTQPRFHGKVSTAGYAMRSSATSFFPDPEKIFLGGIEEGAETIPLPRVLLGMAQDSAQLQTFKEETWITFHREGGFTWRSASAPHLVQHAALQKTTGRIMGKSKLHVKGIVKGKWLVYSENKIIIEDDLLYDQDPEILPGSGDFLGLVSAKDLEIAQPSLTGPGDLKIYAAILAKGRFCVSHFYASSMGTLHVYGSLAAGSVSPTEPRYATRVQFDKRFEKMRPPHFPLTDRYEVSEWNEHWLVK